MLRPFLRLPVSATFLEWMSRLRCAFHGFNSLGNVHLQSRSNILPFPPLMRFPSGQCVCTTSRLAKFATTESECPRSLSNMTWAVAKFLCMCLTVFTASTMGSANRCRRTGVPSFLKMLNWARPLRSRDVFEGITSWPSVMHSLDSRPMPDKDHCSRRLLFRSNSTSAPSANTNTEVHVIRRTLHTPDPKATPRVAVPNFSGRWWTAW